ncbi:MAG TPA: DNA polymerase III subunit beta [Candidatus Paceibacterota bacterium]|nr:DNA polymerase III subunit beta [Candidatus Paceibacterota bacterium]
MKTSCTQERLRAAVDIAERVVGKKESLPVLSCILLEAKGKALYVRATNLETGIEIAVPAEVMQEGVVAVPVGVFSHTVRTSRAEKIELSLDGQNLSIRSPHGETTLRTIAHDEFPSIPKETEGDAYQLSPKALLDGISAVAYAASQSMIRPELASILITAQDGTLTFAATDSFRLAEKRIPARAASIPDTLLPVKNALELTHVLSALPDEPIECRFSDSQLSVTAGTIYFMSRIVDATFPQYQAIIPKEFMTEAVLLKEDLNTTMKKARIFSAGTQQIGFHVYPSKKSFTATARTADIGETSDSIDAALEGSDLDINFNLQYLSDCFSSIRADSVSLQFGGLGKALVIKGVSDPTFLYLVMPLNR